MTDHHRIQVVDDPSHPFTVVQVEGSVDVLSAREFESAVRLALRDQAPGVAVDLRQATGLDALGIQALLNVGRFARRQQRRLVLIDQPRPLRRELAGCLIHRLLMIFPTLEHAREAFPL